MGALAGVVVAAALVLAVVLSTTAAIRRRDEGLRPNWSKWQPSDTSIEGGAAQIAEKVGAEYRHPDGKQLVLVSGGAAAELQVALRPATGQHRGDRRATPSSTSSTGSGRTGRSRAASRPRSG